jgi:hypothetical protein
VQAEVVVEKVIPTLPEARQERRPTETRTQTEMSAATSWGAPALNLVVMVVMVQTQMVEQVVLEQYIILLEMALLERFQAAVVAVLLVMLSMPLVKQERQEKLL